MCPLRVGWEVLLDDALGGFERAVHPGDPLRGGVFAGEVHTPLGPAHGRPHPVQLAGLRRAPAAAGPRVLLPGLLSDADYLAVDAGHERTEEPAHRRDAPTTVGGELECLGVEHIGV